jgi:hypothetical protein
MDALSAAAVAVVTTKAGKEAKPAVVSRQEEVKLSKLIEYCVLLLNQVRHSLCGCGHYMLFFRHWALTGVL